MIDNFIPEKKRAEEYSTLVTHAAKALQDRFGQKGLGYGRINPANPDSHKFEVFSDYGGGSTAFEISFVGDYNEEEMRYVFKDGKVKKEGYTYIDDNSVSAGETYYGEYTQAEKDRITGKNPNDPENMPRYDISFADPLPVELEELRTVSQLIDLLGVDPNEAEKLGHELPWFDQ